MRGAAIAARPDISERCAGNVKSLLASQVPRVAIARVLAKAVRAVEAQTSAVVVDRSVIDDLIALVEKRVPASVASVVIGAKCVDFLVGTHMLGLLRWNPMSLWRKEKFNTCGHCQSMTFLDSRWTLCLFATSPISCLTNLWHPVKYDHGLWC